MIRIAGWFNPLVAESYEMLYQSDSPYLFDSGKFAREFGFGGTPYATACAPPLRHFSSAPRQRRDGRCPSPARTAHAYGQDCHRPRGLPGHRGARRRSGAAAGTRGEILPLPVSALAGSPFADYSVPGAILFIVIGLGPLAAAVLTWRRHRLAPLLACATAGLDHLARRRDRYRGLQQQTPLQALYLALGW